MLSSEIPFISILFSLVLCGVAGLWLVRSLEVIRRIALSSAVLALVMTLVILGNFDIYNPDFQMIVKYSWIPSLNIHFMVGLDGISVLFLPLTALLFVALIVASWNQIHLMPRVYYSLLLLLLLAVFGVFTALDTVMFILFWELTLIPIYFLIALWGKGAHRRYAAFKYILLMMVGGIPLLFGFVILAINASDMGQLVFALPDLLKADFDKETQILIFFLLFIGFAFKVPLFPFHTWLPVVAMEGPIAVAVIMTGLKLGAYGLLRFTIPLAPQAALQFQWLFVTLGVIGILYGALMAFQQTNLRRVLAYASMSHIGMVIVSLASFDQLGIQGAVFQLLNFILISGALFILLGFLHARTGSTEILGLGGVAKTMPLLSAFFFFFAIASIGIPGTSGFPAELMMILSVLNSNMGAGLVVLVGVILSGAYLFIHYRQCFLGKANNSVVGESSDLQARELVIMVVFASLVIILGLIPSIITDITEHTIKVWVANIQAVSQLSF
ncbi:MAG: NADH-quinone oxidoreductase subunit M [Thiotrichaceae bacterium]|nr:NADH-quinone oxidoreductase subunit M [Thiotrichaceae bacterium]